MATYKGFSSRSKKFRVTDFELIKLDLMNHLAIRRGEKLMQPEFGTVIWNMLYEPFTDEIKQIIKEDLLAVAGNDPRIRVTDITVIEFQHGIRVELEITVIETNQTDTLIADFDRRTVD